MLEHGKDARWPLLQNVRSQSGNTDRPVSRRFFDMDRVATVLAGRWRAQPVVRALAVLADGSGGAGRTPPRAVVHEAPREGSHPMSIVLLFPAFPVPKDGANPPRPFVIVRTPGAAELPSGHQLA